ncbi:MAG: hypothetical protein NW208_11555 [Bryobacter sp.]|nr:hypothetical protein [Bryobacter sp.]
MKLLDDLYKKLPVSVQHLAVSAQGWVYRRQRYGQAFRQELKFLLNTEFASPLQLELFQTARLREMLRYAHARIPAYQGKGLDAIAASLRPGHSHTFASLALTPKSLVRTSPESFWPDGQKPKNSIPWSTSGTTGTPMTLFYSPASVSRQYAFVEQYRLQAGVNRFLRRAQFTGKLIAPPGEKQQFWRRDHANNCLLLSTVHLSRQNLPLYLEALEAFQPAYLSGYPSAIALLAQAALRNPHLKLPLRAVLTSAETVTDEQRLLVGSAFGCRIYDQYGQTEMQSFWFECRYGRMHAHPLFGLTEILRPNGEPCRPNEMGDVVLTGFLNQAMPLLRYEVGDRAAFSDESKCPCGRNMPIIAGIEGRRDDYLYSPERGLVGRMDPALKGINGILECQFVQHTPTSLDIYYVPTTDFTHEELARFRANLEDRLGGSLLLRFHAKQSLERGANGKLRAVVSKLDPAFLAQALAEETTVS